VNLWFQYCAATPNKQVLCLMTTFLEYSMKYERKSELDFLDFSKADRI